MTILKYKVHGEVKESLEVEPEYFKGDGLGAKFGNTLLGFWRRAFNSITGWFEERLINFGVGILIKIEKSGATVLSTLVKELKDKNVIPAFLKPIFDEIENPKGEIGAMLAGSAGTTAIGGLFGAIFDPLMAEVKYGLNAWIRPYIPGIGEIVTSWRRGELDEETMLNWGAKNGFSKEMMEIFKSLSRTALDPQTIIQANLRGALPETLVNSYLKRLGYNDADIVILRKLFMQIPPPADLIQMAVKEAFSPEIAMKFGQYQDFPEDFGKWAEQIGISKEWAEKYWAAHWMLPAPEQGFDMAHRGIISDAELKLLLRSQDVMPFWRDKLVELSESLLIPGVADLVQMAVKEAFTPATVQKFGQLEDLPPKFVEWVKKLGVSEEWAKNYWAAHWQLPSPGQGFDMAHRGIITDADLKMLMKSLDVMPFWRDKLIELSDTLLIPGVADLVRMAVREVFSPEVAAKFGQFEDLPPKFVEWVKKLGVSEEWAKNYWAAHWDLPSPSMGFDMLHRGIIDHETLVMLLKSLDVMPYWRDKIIKLAYNVYTRVDVRRMHKTGVITDEEVKAAYLEQGYDDDHASKLAQYTIIANMTPDIEFSKSELLDGFKRGIFEEGELRDGLGGLGLSDNIIDFYIAKAELEKVQESKKTEITYIKTMYQKGGWEVERVNSELGKLGLAAKEMEYYITLWQKEAKTKTTLPTKAELKKWLLSGVIDVDTWYLYMSSLGYSDTVIAWYASDLSTTVETKAKLPSKAELKKWVLNGTIDPVTWYNYMLQLGYSDTEITLYAEQISDEIEAKASEE